MIASTARLFHTVRHLKPVQITSRVLKPLSRPRPDRSPAPDLRLPHGPWRVPVARPQSLLCAWRMRFLNHDGEIANAAQWNDPGQSKLWLYNLHYFDDLCAADAADRRALQRELITRWIAENPAPLGNGWEPYPVSLRIVNWIKWHLAGEHIDAAMRDSLAVQARWLMRHIEWHLLGNHILANAKALVFAGLFFSGPEAETWLQAGLAIYARELPEQILEDGAHFELSPMYHATILEDLLDLANLARHYGEGERVVLACLPADVGAMRSWLAAMTHPDGGLAFFNDAALGIATSRADLEAYAARLGFGPAGAPGDGLHHLDRSGYVRVNAGAMAAILDVGAVGPDYIPGHAHADTLSFELSLGPERIIVNGGTSTYAPGPQRAAERATAAHSTVEVDGHNSSDVWGAFRVARRARIKDLVIGHGTPHEVRASHDGYARLNGRNIHTRTWQFAPSRLDVVDAVSGPFESAIARFHLAPGVTVSIDPGQSSGQLRTAAGQTLRWSSQTPVAIQSSHWHREFGLSMPTQCLAVPLRTGTSHVVFDWQT